MPYHAFKHTGLAPVYKFELLNQDLWNTNLFSNLYGKIYLFLEESFQNINGPIPRTQRFTYNVAKATKEQVKAPALYSRGPGHQLHGEATLALSAPTFPPSPSLGSGVLWWMPSEREKKWFPTHPVCQISWERNRLSTGKGEQGRILTRIRKGNGTSKTHLCFQNPTSQLWNWRSSLKPQHQLQIPCFTRIGYSCSFQCLTILTIYQGPNVMHTQQILPSFC